MKIPKYDDKIDKQYILEYLLKSQHANDSHKSKCGFYIFINFLFSVPFLGNFSRLKSYFINDNPFLYTRKSCARELMYLKTYNSLLMLSILK